MESLLIGLAFVGGYVAAIFTWDRLHTWYIGAAAKAQALRLKAIEVENKARSAFGGK